MNTLKIETGIQEYSLNDKCTVQFNPSDVAFIKKIYDAMAYLDKKQADYKKGMDAIGPDDHEAMFAFMEEQDKQMRETIDGVFNVPICDAVFGEMNVFAFTKDGIPAWASMLLAIIDECNTDQDELKKKGKATINKYIKKYHK